MESLILPSPVDVLHHASPVPEKVNDSTTKRKRLSSISSTRDSSINWGRSHHHGSWIHSLGCLGVMLLSPLLVIFYFITLTSFQGSLSLSTKLLLDIGPLSFFRLYFPQASLKASIGYVAWLFFQAALYLGLPGRISTGQLTPAGNLLKYKTNGLSAWIVTHALFFGLSWYGVLDPAILARNWEGLLVAANVWGFLLTGIAFMKANLSPTHEQDRKFSGKLGCVERGNERADGCAMSGFKLTCEIGSMLYDMYMGIELNPRIGDYFDFKLFTNGRPGIVAWTLMYVTGVFIVLLSSRALVCGASPSRHALFSYLFYSLLFGIHLGIFLILRNFGQPGTSVYRDMNASNRVFKYGLKMRRHVFCPPFIVSRKSNQNLAA